MRKLRFGDWVFAAIAVAVVVAAAFVVTRPSAGHVHTAHQAAYRFEPVTTPAARGTAVPVAFRILDPNGKPVTEFRHHQTKQMHLFAVREDMQGFQHVHPELEGDTWRAELALTDGGAYRMFAEFVPSGAKDPVVLGAPFRVPGDATQVAAAEGVTRTGFTVSRVDEPAAKGEHVLRFAISGPDGAPVRSLQPHLGANAYVIGFHTGSLSATQVHPLEPAGAPLKNGELSFHTVFAESGEYRLFLEFVHGGRVHTAAFTVAVT